MKPQKSGGWSVLILIRGKDFTETYKSTEDLYRQVDGARRVRHVGDWNRSALGESPRELASAIPLLDIAICDFQGRTLCRTQAEQEGSRKSPKVPRSAMR
jgi:hypothetical protein